MNTSSPPTLLRKQSGFTLAEVLLASVLGAMLLTALTLSTYGFTKVLSYHEVNAGIAQTLDPVLRVITRDIREAHWAELVDDTHIRLADHTGAMTDYFYLQNGLWITRPNGDTGELYQGLTAMTFSAEYVTRIREGTPTTFDGTLYAASTPGSSSIAFPVPVGARMSLSFVAPVYDVDAVGAGSTQEQFLSMDADILRVPLQWIVGSGSNTLTVNIYESWAPGSAKPLGSSMGSLTIPGASLPHAVWSDVTSSWGVPGDLVAIGLWSANVNLKPGASYTAVLEASGDAQLLLKAYPLLPSVNNDLVALSVAGSPYVTQPLAIPREISGDAALTHRVSTNTVDLISILVVPQGRPSQNRSAALLSQAVSADPWLGVLPGEVLSP